MLSILYSDEYFTAINKPCGMLVHKTSIANDDGEVALQLLREQTGRMVYPVHRIDRPTSGVLLFAHSSEMAKNLQEELTKNGCHKKYKALIRGWLKEPVIWNRDVKNDRGNLKSAETHFSPVEYFEIPYPTDRYLTARFSIIDALPTTGRWHQIRQHLAQMRHYIINDRVHGDGKQNNIFTNQLKIHEMFLHAQAIEFLHPSTKKLIQIEAPLPKHWQVIREFIIK